ncbi:unnamed protein product [Pieris macdunnoughi]|uniref:C2HC/C3H-type domain-containing protein n=1 Tax=Pieris macdunnoughi TaxID=345717 RepID=A0A821TNP6_9NEOP|nr:unnamed protein product [Pieris macdunnoughi]
MVGLLNYFTCGFINRERGFRRVPSLSDLEVGLAGAQQRLLTRFKADGFSKRHHEQHNSIKSSRSGSPEPSDGPSSVESFRPIQRTPTPSRLGPPPSPPVPTKPVAPAAPEPSGPLMPCAICGRTFVPQSLSKHVKICEKMTVKKRKTFDSSRQRREGTDLEQYLPKNFGLPENSPFLEKSPPNTAKATPKPKPQSVRTAIMKPTADLQKCPHCGRAFGVRAFERHVDWCADKAKILPAASAQAPPHITDAKQRLNARTQYKAPPVRTRRSSQTREKSSRSASVESSRGVSPPREFGDYKHPQSRASESGSSNDYHEESSPHIPVIRNSRSSQNKSSGDANIKARQARLAKDLSSTRNNEEPIALQSKTDPINKQHDQKKPRLNVRKKQQLKNLEEIAEKHKARSEKIIADQKRIKEKIAASKSQIPIRNQQKTQITNCDDILKQELNTEEEEVSVAKLKPKSNYSKKKSISSKSRRQKDNTVKKETVKKLKESTMSLDSLEDCPPKSDREQRSQSIGINTELLCPCVPCVIHDTSSDKTKSKNRSSSTTNKTRVDKTDELLENTITVPSPSVELLFKNLTMVSSCDISTDLREQNDHDDIVHNLSENSIPNYPTESKELCKNPAYEGEIFEENYERDLSEDSFECDNKKEIEIKEDENETNLISRHGSGDTYTKFMDNPADLEEFLTLTDNMMTCETKCQEEFSKNIEDLHTPKTNSIESICLKNNDNITMKHNFSESFEELKNNFKDLLQEAQEFPPSNSEETRKVSDLEHITVYELKLYEQEENTKDVPIEPDKKIKLPSIAENNKGPQKGKNNIASIYKDNRKVKMQKRTDKDYQTYIIKERRDESSDEAPPLKLPRIELKSSNNIVGDKLLPSSVKRSTSLLDSIQKKPAKIEPKIRHKTDQLEDDIMQSLKEFDKFYESQKNEKSHSNKDLNMNKRTYIDTVKRGSRKKIEQNNKCDNIINGNHTPGGKISNDSAYSRLVSLNRVSPSKLSLCNVKESNDTVLLEQPGGSDTSESHKEDRRSISSEEFLAMEKSTETEETLTRSDMHSSYNNVEHISVHEKRTSSRVSTHRTSHRNIKEALSSSGSETSLSRVRREQHSAPRLSRFCHECGSKFPDKAKFCIECGVKRLLV